MCGITAALGLSAAAQKVYQALEVLQNRGYDSAGIASLRLAESPVMEVSRFANQPGRSGLQRLQADLSTHQDATIAIGHTRWATHGGITDANTHPHLDTNREIAVVHNGIIENYYPLKRRLQAEGVVFSSETDTEVIPQLIRYYLKHSRKPVDPVTTADPIATYLDAIHAAIGQLEGTWGLVIMIRDTPNTLYVCKKGSPLLVGYEQNYALVSSEPSGFINLIKQYFSLPDNKILALTTTPEGLQIRDKELTIKDPAKNFALVSTNSNPSGHAVINATTIFVQTSPAPYLHWMYKEIMEQAESTQRCLNYGGRLKGEDGVQLGGLAQHQEELLCIEDLLLTGCGTSWHAALLGAHYLQALGGFRTVQVKEASEFTLADLPRATTKTGLLALSQSGETKDLHRVIESIRQNARQTSEDRTVIFSVVNVVDSLIAREALCGVYLNAGREVAVASTKSFTSQVLALQQIAIWFAQNRNTHRQERTWAVKSLRESRHLMVTTLHEFSNSQPLQELVQTLKTSSKIFLLGRGPGLAIALEGALKIKEVAYLHAEGYPGGALKHGPFALIEQDTPIILLSYQDENAQRMDTAAIETRARGAYTIAITSRPDINRELYDVVLTVPHDPLLSPLLSIIPLQFLAYYLATAQGHNPDYPRNLAKVVTVDG